MMLQLHRRLLPAVLCLTLAALAATGCSKSTKPKTNTPPSFSHEEADDIAQYIGASMAIDNGGWYGLVKALAESLYVTSTNSPGTSDTTAFALAMPGPSYVNSYNFELAYYDVYQVGRPTRDNTSSELEANVHMAGGQLRPPPGNVTIATYGYDSDWSFIVYNLKADYDTLEFSGIVSDSSFVTINSTITPGRTKFWLHINDFYPTIYVRKSLMPGNPYAVGGDVEWLLDAYNMKADTTRDVTHSDNYLIEILAEAHMSFDGTADATFRLLDDVVDTVYEYDYKINLKTGAITRLN